MAGDDAFIAARGIHSVLRGDPARDDNVSVEPEQADASSLTAGGQISGSMRALLDIQTGGHGAHRCTAARAGKLRDVYPHHPLSVACVHRGCFSPRYPMSVRRRTLMKSR